MKRRDRLKELVEEHGSWGVGNFVCSNCVIDKVLVEAIRMAGHSSSCDYCGQVPVLPDASADVGLVVEIVREGISHEYESVIESVAYDSEDGYLVPGPSWDTYTLLWSELEISDDENVLREVADGLGDIRWCQQYPYAASPADALEWGWQEFREFVKHRRRYTFLSHDDSTADGAGSLPMHEVPAAVARAVEASGLVTTIPAGTIWWRARAEQISWWRVLTKKGRAFYSTAAEIGPPPDVVARDNRMTPKGIGAFYGAATPGVAVAEVAGYARSRGRASVGKFTTTVELVVVDLREPPPVPSLFDPDRRHLRAATRFMRGFAEDVRKTAKPDDKQNLDYVPTQVVAEYFRHELSGSDRDIAGVLWKSSKEESVDVCVLFVPSDKVADLGEQDAETVLMLDPASVRRLPIGRRSGIRARISEILAKVRLRALS